MPEHEVHRALLDSDPQDQLVIAYRLVVDNKRIADESKYIFNIDVSESKFICNVDVCRQYIKTKTVVLSFKSK